MVACTLVVRGVCSLALLDQVLLRLSTCLMGGSETNSTPLVLLRPSTCLMVSSEENSTPLVLLRLSNSQAPLCAPGRLRRELDPSCFTASQYGSGLRKSDPEESSTHLQNERMSHVGVHVICSHVVLSLLDSCSNLLFGRCANPDLLCYHYGLPSSRIGYLGFDVGRGVFCGGGGRHRFGQVGLEVRGDLEPVQGAGGHHEVAGRQGRGLHGRFRPHRQHRAEVRAVLQARSQPRPGDEGGGHGAGREAHHGVGAMSQTRRD